MQANAPRNLDASLLAPLPNLTSSQLDNALREHFGIDGDLTPISGERDLNFRVTNEKGDKFVLKVSGASDTFEELTFQNAALLHLEKNDPALPVPRVRFAQDRSSIVALEKQDRQYFLRVLSYLDGQPMLGDLILSRQRRDVGSLAARLVAAFKNFSHIGAARPFIWDIAQFHDLGGKIAFIENRERRALVEAVHRRFIDRVLPKLPNLRRQVVHNDLNQNNILLNSAEGTVSGIIDFGDMVDTITIAELAIAAAHQLYGQTDILAAVADVLTGYSAHDSVTQEEFDILLPLIEARLASREIIVAWRKHANPSATTSYRDDVSKLGWDAINRCAELTHAEARDYFISAVGATRSRNTGGEVP